MNTSLTALYAVILDNKIVLVDTNLKLFVEQFEKLNPHSRNYQWFYRAFKKEEYFSLVVEDKEYHFQKVI